MDLLSTMAAASPFERLGFGGSGLDYYLSSIAGNASFVFVIVLIYSLFQCYFGYPIFRVMIIIQGVIIGLASGGLLGTICGMPWGILFPIIFGVLFGILANVLHKLGVFCFFFTLIALITLAVVFLMSQNVMASAIVACVFGIAGGIIGVIIERYFIIFTTAICNGFLAGLSIGVLSRNVYVLGISLGLVFAVTGILVQLALTKKKDAKKAPQVVTTVPTSGSIQYQNVQPMVMPRICLSCGVANDADSQFCYSCGKPLNVQPAAEQVQPAAEQIQPVSEQVQPAAEQIQPVSEQVQPAAEQVQPEEKTWTCAACSAQNSESVVFCKRCGQSMYAKPVFDKLVQNQPESIFCVACGTKNTTDSVFCCNCGQSLN